VDLKGSKLIVTSNGQPPALKEEAEGVS